MRPSGDIRLYERLPAHVRARDFEAGRPLEALLRIVQDEFELVESDIQQLFENWFIETADEWVVPYIADLLAVRNLRPIESAGFSMRAYVANTLRYRQGKGTPAVLEEVASTVSGWDARVVEFFQLLQTTQHLNHVRLGQADRTEGRAWSGNPVVTDIRDPSRMQLIDTAFDTCAHTAEVRRIGTRLGRHNIPNVGIFLWRLEPYYIEKTAIRGVEPVIGERFFHFGPLSMDFPLFNRPKDEQETEHIANERNVPTTIRRLAMRAHKNDYLNPREPVIQCFIDSDTPLAPEAIIICHLQWEDAGWQAPKSTNYPGALVAVDPERARLFLMDPMDLMDPLIDPDTVRVSYTYGFSGDLGGGPYDRRDGTTEDISDRGIRIRVAKDGSGEFTTIHEALASWNAVGLGRRGVIAITDNASYEEDLGVTIKPDSDLLIVACKDFDPDRARAIDLSGRRPHVQGNITITGEATGETDTQVLTLNGLMVEGAITVAEGDLRKLKLKHCTVTAAPWGPTLILPPVLVALPHGAAGVGAVNARLEVEVVKCIVAGIDLTDHANKLCVQDSIIDAPGIVAIQARGSECTVDRSTVFGKEEAVAEEGDPEWTAENNELNTPAMQVLFASESIFTGRVVVERNQEGCARFCYFTEGSMVPRRYRCQPDLALDALPDAATAANKAAVRARLRPQFSSTTYGEPDYAQLRLSCDVGIRTGAEDGSEMGAFEFLKQPHREANLRIAVQEYLPFGLQAAPLFIDEANAFRATYPFPSQEP